MATASLFETFRAGQRVRYVRVDSKSREDYSGQTGRIERTIKSRQVLVVRWDVSRTLYDAAPVNLELIDETPAGLQCVLPGAEHASDAAMAQRRADLPLKPKTAQRPCDDGLFSDTANQKELF